MFRAVFLTGIHLLLFDMIHMKIRQNGISISICRDQIQSHHKLYYKFLYIPPGMLYDGIETKGMARKRKEEFRMDRYTVIMRHEHLEFLLCSFKQELCSALHCPEMTHERDLKQPAL